MHMSSRPSSRLGLYRYWTHQGQTESLIPALADFSLPHYSAIPASATSVRCSGLPQAPILRSLQYRGFGSSPISHDEEYPLRQEIPRENRDLINQGLGAILDGTGDEGKPRRRGPRPLRLRSIKSNVHTTKVTEDADQDVANRGVGTGLAELMSAYTQEQRRASNKSNAISRKKGDGMSEHFSRILDDPLSNLHGPQEKDTITSGSSRFTASGGHGSDSIDLANESIKSILGQLKKNISRQVWRAGLAQPRINDESPQAKLEIYRNHARKTKEAIHLLRLEIHELEHKIGAPVYQKHLTLHSVPIRKTRTFQRRFRLNNAIESSSRKSTQPHPAVEPIPQVTSVSVLDSTITSRSPALTGDSVPAPTHIFEPRDLAGNSVLAPTHTSESLDLTGDDKPPMAKGVRHVKLVGHKRLNLNDYKPKLEGNILLGNGRLKSRMHKRIDLTVRSHKILDLTEHQPSESTVHSPPNPKPHERSKSTVNGRPKLTVYRNRKLTAYRNLKLMVHKDLRLAAHKRSKPTAYKRLKLTIYKHLRLAASKRSKPVVHKRSNLTIHKHFKLTTRKRSKSMLYKHSNLKAHKRIIFMRSSTRSWHLKLNKCRRIKLTGYRSLAKFKGIQKEASSLSRCERQASSPKTVSSNAPERKVERIGEETQAEVKTRMVNNSLHQCPPFQAHESPHRTRNPPVPRSFSTVASKFSQISTQESSVQENWSLGNHESSPIDACLKFQSGLDIKPESSALSPPPSALLPKSPVFSFLDSRNRSPKSIPTEESNHRLSADPFAAMLASPIRQCRATGIRLPSAFLTEWNVLRDPNDQEPSLLPVGLSPNAKLFGENRFVRRPWLMPPVAEKTETDETNRTSPEPAAPPQPSPITAASSNEESPHSAPSTNSPARRKTLHPIRLLSNSALIHHLTLCFLPEYLPSEPRPKKQTPSRLLSHGWAIRGITGADMRNVHWREGLPGLVQRLMGERVVEGVRWAVEAETQGVSEIKLGDVSGVREGEWGISIKVDHPGALLRLNREQGTESPKFVWREVSEHDGTTWKSKVPVFSAWDLMRPETVEKLRGLLVEHGNTVKSGVVAVDSRTMEGRAVIAELWKLTGFLESRVGGMEI